MNERSYLPFPLTQVETGKAEPTDKLADDDLDPASSDADEQAEESDSGEDSDAQSSENDSDEEAQEGDSDGDKGEKRQKTRAPLHHSRNRRTLFNETLFFRISCSAVQFLLLKLAGHHP